jgi:hypothetical protein
MHGVGAKQAIEVARSHPFDRRADGANGLEQAALGILGQQQAMNAPRRILQRRFDGMQAEQANRTIGIAFWRAVPVLSMRLGLVAAVATGMIAGKSREGPFLAPRLFERFFWQVRHSLTG